MASNTKTDNVGSGAGVESQTSAASPAKATDQVLNIRIELINGIGDAALKALLDGLQKPTPGRPPVITARERNEVLQKHSGTEDQVTCLVDMVRKKGERACERFLSLLKDVEPGVYAPPAGGSGEGIPLQVSISATDGSHVLAPTMSHNTIQGNVSNTSHHHHHHHHAGSGDSAATKPTQQQGDMVPPAGMSPWLQKALLVVMIPIVIAAIIAYKEKLDKS